MSADEPIGLLIGAVRRRIRQAVGSHVRRYQLTTQQFWVLVAIHEHPGFSLRQLAAHLRMDEPTASRVVAALMRRKLVQVKGDAADRRRACIHLRVPGAELGKELRDLATTVRAAVVQGLSTSEQAALRGSLRKIIANMDRLQNHKTTNIPDSEDA
ncbi:MAG TPA: MarR family transcriptional regulator [Candidatus Margulisiibacteriota bacterium]|nr:MarR family transcriptional regulator [Candidatus Margulisiibacteriota bacterium]